MQLEITDKSLHSKDFDGFLQHPKPVSALSSLLEKESIKSAFTQYDTNNQNENKSNEEEVSIKDKIESFPGSVVSFSRCNELKYSDYFSNKSKSYYMPYSHDFIVC